MTTGALAEVEVRDLGSELITDAPAGSLVLSLDLVSDFDEDGGQLILNDVVLSYVTVDPDAETITLAAPLAAAALTGDPVTGMQAGAVAQEWIGHVSLDEGDNVPAIIPTALRRYFFEGQYDDGTQVELTQVGSGYEVTSKPQQEASFDGAAVWNPRARLGMAAATVPNDVWTQLGSWTVGEAEGLSVTDGVSVLDQNSYPGTYQEQGVCSWAANASGRRGIRLVRDGVPIDDSTFLTGAEPTGKTWVPTFDLSRFEEPGKITLEVYQNSGAALAVVSGKFTMFRVSS